MSRRSRWLIFFIGAIGLIVLLYFFFFRSDSATPSFDRRGMNRDRATPVKVVPVRIGEMPVYVTALGTMTANNTAVVRARVDGLLERVLFVEGQSVKAGQVLAELDRRPFQIALEQARGQLARDEAQLANANIDLERYQGLLAKNSIARQVVDTQAATVRQLQGVVAADRAQVNANALQLSFTRITAPTDGRSGLRQVDIGNQVRTSDANGIVTITQTQPINGLFAIPADHLPTLLQQFSASKTARRDLVVEAFDRNGKQIIATGKLSTIDNQIDSVTGTIKLKAEFANADHQLFPNQFINIRLQLDRLTNAVIIPAAAVQRGTQGTFVFVSKTSKPGTKTTVELRVLELGVNDGDQVVVNKGLQAGEFVVIDGADKLRGKASIEIGTEQSGRAGSKKPESGASTNRRRPHTASTTPPAP